MSQALDNNEFPDQLDALRVQQAQLQRRRALAESLVKQSMAPQGAAAGGYQGGKVYMVGSPIGQIAQAIGGAYMGDKVDSESTDLAARQAQAQNAWQTEFAAADSPAAKQQALVNARNRGLRSDLEKGFYDTEIKQNEAEAARQMKAQEIAAEKEANRQFLEQQKALDRQNRMDVRSTPTIHITNSGGGAGPQSFGGAAPVIGSNPRDDSPIYRHTKSGQLFQFDENGQPTPYAGAVAPKPVPMDAATRKNVHEANLGVQGVDDALAKLQAPKATGATGPMNALPGAEVVRQYTDTPEAIDARAAVANIGSLKLHDRSGAAVTISEFPRLAPFIPKVTDSPVAAARKLNNLKAEYQRMQAEWSGKPTAPAAAPTGRLKFNPATGKVE